MNIWDIDTKTGIWLDGSHWSADDLNKAIVYLTASTYGFKAASDLPPENSEAWTYEADDALDYLNSILPHGYFFYIEDNSLFLGSEDE